LVVACRRSEPQPRPTPAPAPVIVADAGVAPAISYRTDASTYHVDPKLVGTGATSMVASEDHHASEAGEAMLIAGGNAVDAAVTTAFVLAVTHPSAGNLAGGGFAIVRAGKGQASALDFRETAPAAATPDMYLDAGGNPTKESLIGDRACGVPGSVAGLYELHHKYGKKKWAEVLAPAIKLATDGFVVEDQLHDSLVRVLGYRKSITTAPLWWPNSKPLEVGVTVKNPELAVVLGRIAAQGPDGFYKGDTAKAIVDEMQRGKGLITAADLAGYKAVWREPLHASYRGKQIIAMPPPSSGGIVVAMTANMLKNVELGKLPWHGEEHLHRVVEVWRRAFAARNEILGDPAYVKDMPVAKLMSQAYADELAKTITDKATPSKTVTGLIEGTHTTNLSVVDKSGMAVAMTTTLNTSFGNAIQVRGFLLNNEMDDFAAKPGSPNVYGLVMGTANKIEAGKRMLSSMSPTILEDEHGDLYMVVGGQGGPRIITEVWQVISNVIDFDMPVADAIAAPRFHHQHLPDDISLEEDSISADTAKQLETAGYKLTFGKGERIYGAANAIVHTKDGWQGAADPRGGGAAVGD
ncbi:MAG TPA: gamma-glutamyltransferase, partial [Kofleriaceae bacterium]|nr:gamma-glutamyltransferase [Kofleriaceae bacterium]